MVDQLYYYDYPQPFHSLAPLKPADDSMNYWFGYPSQAYPEAQEVKKEKKKDEKKEKKEEIEEKEDKKEEKEDKKEEKKQEKKEEKKEGKKDEKKDAKKDDKKPKVIEMRVHLCCESCARKVRRKLEKMNGVEKPVICDMYENKVTVTATAIPDDVLYNVQKVKKDAEFWPKK